MEKKKIQIEKMVDNTKWHQDQINFLDILRKNTKIKLSPKSLNV